MQKPQIMNANPSANHAALINLKSGNNNYLGNSRGALSDDIHLTVQNSQNINAGPKFASLSNTPNNFHLTDAVTYELNGEQELNAVASTITDQHSDYLNRQETAKATSVVQSEDNPSVQNYATQQSKLTLLFQTKALEDKVTYNANAHYFSSLPILLLK